MRCAYSALRRLAALPLGPREHNHLRSTGINRRRMEHTDGVPPRLSRGTPFFGLVSDGRLWKYFNPWLTAALKGAICGPSSDAPCAALVPEDVLAAPAGKLPGTPGNHPEGPRVRTCWKDPYIPVPVVLLS